MLLGREIAVMVRDVVCFCKRDRLVTVTSLEEHCGSLLNARVGSSLYYVLCTMYVLCVRVGLIYHSTTSLKAGVALEEGREMEPPIRNQNPPSHPETTC